jgi:hypothetical protein
MEQRMSSSVLSNTASTSDVLTAIKNIVLALSTAAQNYLNVQGATNKAAITAPTVVKNSPGRVCSVSVIVGGAGTGFIYDATSLTDTTKPLYIIPDTVGLEPYVVNLPASFGIVVVPGSGQKITVSYS